MISQIREGSPPRPQPAFNLAAHVLAAGAAVPGKAALQILRPAGAERWSYERLTAAVRGVATGLLAAGLEPGDRVLLRLGNTVDFPLAFLGAIAAGLVPCPSSAALTRPEVTRLAAILAPKAIIAAPGLARPEEFAEQRPESNSAANPARAPALVIPAATLRGFEALPPADWHLGSPDRPGYIVFTSGTSGTPRGVIHAHRAILGRAMMHAGWIGLDPADRLMHAGAFNWTYTLGTGLLDPWTRGATALIPAEGVAPAQLPLLMRRFDATIFAAAPGIYRQLLRAHPSLDLPKLRHGLCAGEKLPEALRAAWEAASGRPLHEALGMSEVSTFISGAPARPARPGSLGWVQEGRHVAVLGPGGAPVPRDAPGELAIDRDDPGLFLGYLDAPEATAARFSGRWFCTGDMVRMDAEGALFYLGRSDDMLNAGGYRVSPVEIEEAMATHPDILECAAIALPVRADTSVVALAFVPRTAAPPDAAGLAAHAAGCLARYKQPRLWCPVAEMPRNANGKVNRRALRDSLARSHTPSANEGPTP